MDFEAFLRELSDADGYRGQIAHVQHVPARRARYAEPREPLTGRCARLLAEAGIEHLYRHQAQALDAARAGRNVVVTTPTASGKTTCFLLPVLERLEQDREARALALYPTKALSQDQLRVFEQARAAAGLADVRVGVVDGDTPASQRRRLRDRASVLITNPDMLHAAILPQHPRWAALFARLTHVVVDELHTYTGLFGANVANLFRRLERVCRHYGSRPQFLCASAAVANPAEAATTLLGRPVHLVADDGSPSGPRTYVLWNPPIVRDTGSHRRRSANVEAAELMAQLVRAGAPAIAFSKAKVTAELIHRYVRETLERAAPGLAPKVTPYRGGYLATERREIERRLFSGELVGISSTPALEMGIDVGELEACIVVGYPGTLASFFQQAGRAGRRDRPALVVLVGLDTTINQYIMRHPDYLFGRPVEEVVIQPDNPYVVLGHLGCAAYELPLRDDEVAAFGPSAPLALDVLESQHKLYHDRDRGAWHHSAPEVPHHDLPLRGSAEGDVVILDTAHDDRVIGQLNKFDAPPIVHPEAIYLHQGETYFVDSLDMDRGIARVHPVSVDYYTQPLDGTDVDHVDHRLRERPFGTGRIFFGEVTVHFRSAAYEKIHFYTLDALSVHPIDLPTQFVETTAFWLEPPEAACGQVMAAGLSPHAGCRGIGYATRMVLPLFVQCDTRSFSHSVGAVNAPWQTIFIYERYRLGLGYTERAYDIAGRLLPAVLDHIRACGCADGCPCCVGKPLRQYATWNVERREGSIPSKRAALMILEALLGDGSNLDAPDTTSLGQDEADVRLVLERSLRRRAEHNREPLIPHPIHPIEHAIATGYPTPEPAPKLKAADVARRAFRRLKHDKAIARGERKPTPSTPEPTVPDAIPRGAADARVQPPIKVGDSLASLARRRKRSVQSNDHPDAP